MKVGFEFSFNGLNCIVCDIKEYNGRKFANVCVNDDKYKTMEIINSDGKIKFSEIKDEKLLSLLLPLFIFDNETEEKMEKYLPIGTVLILKGGEKRIMITGFACKSNGSEKVYDYCGCLYPEGFISSEQSLLFDHEQIDKIFYMGFVDDEELQFKIKLKEAIKNSNY